MRGLIVRHRFDIQPGTLLRAILEAPGACPREEGRRLEAMWSSDADALACLSVRSGLDLMLRCLELPEGSEIVTSAVTIPSMADILRHHGLVPVPVDLNLSTLAVEPRELERAVTPRTRAILVAHLFGSRMPMDAVLEVAGRLGVPVWEDCAQAFDGPGFTGHEGARVSFFSFGPIKTCTALGGALLRVRDRPLLARMRELQEVYPLQPSLEFAGRCLKTLVALGASHRTVLAILVRLCQLARIDVDEAFNAPGRSFPRQAFFPAIRRRPCGAMLRLLRRRLEEFDPEDLRRRESVRSAFVRRLPERLAVPGRQARRHTYWLLPVLSASRELLPAMRRAGFDATRGTSSLTCLDPKPERCARMMQQILYLPVHPDLTPDELDRLFKVLVCGG
ncbi:MAG: DegT/DnrJ/EryC1/StrS family aminotransferase [Candidatus Eremiobacterota bacterium]